MSEELCHDCGMPTGRAGRAEDSIYICYPEGEIGPLCEECRAQHWVCVECGEAVHPEKVTFDETHEGCGGLCE